MRQRHLNKAFTMVEFVLVLVLLGAISGLVLLNNNAIINFAQYRMIKQVNLTKTLYSTFGELTHLSNILNIEPVQTGTHVSLYYYNTKSSTISYVNTQYVQSVSIGKDFVTATIDMGLLQGLPMCYDTGGRLVDCIANVAQTPTLNKLYIRRFITDYPVIQSVNNHVVTFSAPFEEIWDQFNYRVVPCTTPVQTEVAPKSGGEQAYITTLTGGGTVKLPNGKTACKTLTIGSNAKVGDFALIPAVFVNTTTVNAMIIMVK